MKQIIRFKNVSKHYDLGTKRAHISYLVPNFIKRRMGEYKLQTNDPSAKLNEIWALQDVTFDIFPGETLGIVGPNGAGKTTTLSLMAGITAPTNGEIEVNGRISALIQLGPGFHPDLTGRENIYLNSAIMGLSKKEVNRIIGDIITFSELEDFIDTPIKRYSSGMTVRLGFSVAIYTNPDILLVDEVLAVGDASFKSKCYRRLHELREAGTTVVLVSHDMSQIKNLCDRAILLQAKVIASGSTDEIINRYYQLSFKSDQKTTRPIDQSTFDIENKKVHSPIEIVDVKFFNKDGVCTDSYITGESLRIQINYRAHEPIYIPSFGVSIHAYDGTFLTGSNTKISGYQIEVINGEGSIDFVIPTLMLLPGTYLVGVVIHDRFMGSYDRREQFFQFSVIKGPATAGIFYSNHYWELKPGI